METNSLKTAAWLTVMIFVVLAGYALVIGRIAWAEERAIFKEKCEQESGVVYRTKGFNDMPKFLCVTDDIFINITGTTEEE